MGGDGELVTALERAGPHDHQPRTGAVGVVEPGEAFGAGELVGDALPIGARQIEPRHLAGDAEPLRRHDRLLTERTAAPRLAVEAMARIGAREGVGGEMPVDGAAAAVAFDSSQLNSPHY